MTVFLFIVFIIAAIYFSLLTWFWWLWKKVPVFKPSSEPQTKVSVIIPARNEEIHIRTLLELISRQSYPREKTEVILVDDDSTDQTASVAAEFSWVRVIRLREKDINSYKKKALETGIAAATGELIITTDADCMPPPEWIKTLASFYEEKNAAFIAAPVIISGNATMLGVFQSLDFMMLQGITAGAAHHKKLSMCNGANLAYPRKIFEEVGGFTGIDDIASGDDMLLMHKIVLQYPERVYYLKSRDAIVATRPARTWKEFFSQRIRWASKSRRFDDKKLTWILLLVYIFNLSFLVLLVASFWNINYLVVFILLLVLKYFFENPLISAVSTFFKKGSELNYFFLVQPLHIGYTLIAGWFGQFGSYEWKGRRVK